PLTPASEETPVPVTETAAAPRPADGAAARPLRAVPSTAAPAPSGRDESPEAVTESGGPHAPATPNDDQQQQNREWEQQADRERRQFQARLKPVPEFGEGYQMA